MKDPFSQITYITARAYVLLKPLRARFQFQYPGAKRFL